MTKSLCVSRRNAIRLSIASAALAYRTAPASAAETLVKVGYDAPFTGAQAYAATRLRNGIIMAFDEANTSRATPGYRIEMMVLDDGTATAGGPDPAQAAINARKMASDPEVVAAIGPLNSSAAKAMAPILNQAGLATITPTATNPDLTSPKFLNQYRPTGKVTLFRTVTTDAYQGPAMANFFAATLRVKSVFVLDDGEAFGIGIADAFQTQAESKGVKVLGRDRLDEKASDYTTVLTKIKRLNPEALYFGGLPLAGVKLAKQGYDIIPKVIKAGGDGVYGSDMLVPVGFPAIGGWYASLATPHMVGAERAAEFTKRYLERFGRGPSDYTFTAHDAALVIIDAIKRVAVSGDPVTRNAVRDQIQAAQVDTIQGRVSFDENGDIRNHIISIFQARKNDSKPIDDVTAQFTYVGAAPEV
jgi:branched-chain amino acid transport system substrate-binding protein